MFNKGRATTTYLIEIAYDIGMVGNRLTKVPITYEKFLSLLQTNENLPMDVGKIISFCFAQTEILFYNFCFLSLFRSPSQKYSCWYLNIGQ